MLRIVRFLIVFSIVGVAGCGQTDFTLSDGQKTSLSDYKGSWVVVNYWAVWCKPCVEEIPQLNTLNERDGITVLGVNFDGIEGDELAAQAETLGIAYKMIAHDPSDALDIKRPSVLPATVMIDKTGEVREVLFGPQTVQSVLDRMR